MSRGQWEALRMMSDTRDQVAMLRVPSYAIYLMPTSAPEEARLLTSDEAMNFTQAVAMQKLQPVLTIKPTLASPDNLEPLVVQPVGEQFTLTLNPKLQTQAIPDSFVTSASPMQPHSLSNASQPARGASQPLTYAAMIPASELRSLLNTSDSANAAVLTRNSALIVPITDPAP
jgi:hypothetical protein